MNKVFIVGRLGKDPELRQTQSGKAVCNLNVATSEKFGEKEITEWHRVVTWSATAENCAKYLKKGRQVLVEGRIQTNEWEKDGEKRYTTEIVAERVEFLGSGDKKEPSSEKVDF